jgi:hypothetical protein
MPEKKFAVLTDAANLSAFPGACLERHVPKMGFLSSTRRPIVVSAVSSISTSATTLDRHVSVRF